MDLTLDMIYDLPKKIIDNSVLCDEQVARISEKVCKEYNISEMKSNLFYMFSKFNSVKFYYNIKTEELVKITPSYDIKDYMSQRNTDSQTERAVTEKYDRMIWASKFYESVISLSNGLTKEEAIYLAYGIIGRNSNAFLADMMGTCERTVTTVGKSCILKSWVALETLYKEVSK